MHTVTSVLKVALISFIVTLIVTGMVVGGLVLGSAGIALLITYVFGGLQQTILIFLAVAAAMLVGILALGRLVRALFSIVAERVAATGLSTGVRWVGMVVGVTVGALSAYALLPAGAQTNLTDALRGSAKRDWVALPASPEHIAQLATQICPAAELGDSFAQWQWSEAYRNGSFGVTVDLAMTKKWLDLSAAGGEFDALLTQAVYARSPTTIAVPHTQTNSERHYVTAALQALIPRAPDARVPALLWLISEQSRTTAALSAQADAVALEALSKAARLGSGFATARVAEALERWDAVAALAMYERADLITETDRMWQALPDNADTQRLNQLRAEKNSPLVRDAVSLQKMIVRANMVGARDRRGASNGAYPDTLARIDAQAHALMAIEQSGFTLTPQSVLLQTASAAVGTAPELSRVLAPRSDYEGPEPEFYAFARALRGDCEAAFRAGSFIRDNTRVDRATAFEANFAWSAAFFRLAANCTPDAAFKSEAETRFVDAAGRIDFQSGGLIDQRIALLAALLQPRELTSSR